jgi:hypothetical protein
MLTVLYEDNHCLAVNKPARLLTMGDSTGDESLVDQAREYIREKYHKPGQVFVGVVHRLDRPVSGPAKGRPGYRNNFAREVSPRSTRRWSLAPAPWNR